MLAIATLLTVLDSIAAGVDIFTAAIGDPGANAATVAYGAEANRVALAAVNDVDVRSDLLSVFTTRAHMLTRAALLPALQGGMIQRTLDRHYGAVGNLNTFLKNNDARVHPNLNVIGMQIDARNVFAPQVVGPVASFVGSGAGTGIYTAGLDVNTALYGPAAFEVVVDAMGASARTIRITLKTFDGDLVTRDVVLPANAVANTAIPIGAGSDRFVGVSNIVTVGGGGLAGDAVHVRSKVERVIAL